MLAAANAEPAQGRACRRHRRRGRLSTTDQLLKADGLRAADRRLPRTARRCGSADVADGRRTRSRTSASPGWSTASRAVLIIIFRQPGANIIDTVDRVNAAAAAAAAPSIPPAIDITVAHRPHDDHPRLGPRRRAHAADLDRRW